jgi:hypothetical protein
MAPSDETNAFELLLTRAEFTGFVEHVGRGNRVAAIDALVAAVVAVATQSPTLGALAGVTIAGLRERAAAATNRMLEAYERAKADGRAAEDRQMAADIVREQLEPWFIGICKQLAEVQSSVQRNEAATLRVDAKMDEQAAMLKELLARVPSPPVHLYMSRITDRSRVDYEDAAASIRRGDYERASGLAEAQLAGLIPLVEAGQDQEARGHVAQWRHICAVALFNQQRFESAGAQLAITDVELLGPREHLQIAHLFAELNEFDRAQSLIDAMRSRLSSLDASTQRLFGDVQLLVELCRGQVPEELPENPEIQLKAAQILATQGRLRHAVALAHLASAAPNQPDLYRAVIHLVMMRAVSDSVWGRPAVEHLPASELGAAVDAVQAWQDKVVSDTLPAVVQAQVNGALYEYYEATYDLDGREHLEARGLAPLTAPGFQEALDKARRGDDRGALESLPVRASDAAWVRPLDAARLALIAGDRKRFRAQLEDLAAQYPGVGPICLALALEYSQDGPTERALSLARGAHDAVPAPSYRAVLAHCLSAAGYLNEAWSTLSSDIGSSRPRIVVQLAELAEKVRPYQAPALWQRYGTMTGRWQAHLNAAVAMARVQRRAEAASLAWDLCERHAEVLDPSALFTCARLQGFAESQIEGVARVREIGRILDRRFPDDPKAQQARLLLLIELGDEADAPFDKFGLLEQAGVLYRLELDDQLEEPSALAPVGAGDRQSVWRLYESGGISLEHLALVSGERLCEVVVRMGSDARYFVGPVALVAMPLMDLSGTELLLGEAELLLLGHLGILTTLARAAKDGGTGVLVPHDAYERLQASSISPLPLSVDAERVVRVAVDFVVKGVQEGWLTVADWPELHAELGQALPIVPERRAAAAPENLVRAPMIAALRFAGAVLSRPTRWRVSVDFFGHYGVHHPWVIQSLAWHDLSDYSAGARVLQRASARTLTVAQLVGLIRQSLSIVPVRALPLSKRLVRLGFADAIDASDILSMVREASGDLASEIGSTLAGLEHMALSSNAFARSFGRGVVAETYSSAVVSAYLGVKSTQEEMEGVESSAPLLQERNSVAIEDRDAVSKKEARALAHVLLSRVEALREGEAVLETMLLRIAMRSLRHLRDAVVRIVGNDGSYEISSASPVGQLWTDVRDWANSERRQSKAIFRALRNAWCVLDAISEAGGPVRGQYGPLLLAQRVASDLPVGGFDKPVDRATLDHREAEAVLSWRWNERTLKHDGLWFQLSAEVRREITWETILVEAAASLEVSTGAGLIPFNERRMRFDVPLDATGGQDGHGLHATVFVPIEAVFLRMDRTGIERVARPLQFLQGRHDGNAYQMLEAIAAHPDDQILKEKYARYTVTALWRLVRDDPTCLRHWPERHSVGSDDSRPSLEGLCRILHVSYEPVGTRTHVEWLNAQLEHVVDVLDTGSPVAQALFLEVAQQVAEMPGASPRVVFSLLMDGLPGTALAALERLKEPEWQPAAGLARDVMFLSLLSVTNPTHVADGRTIDLRETLPTGLASLFGSLCSPSEVRGPMVEHESALLRVAADVAWRVMEDRGDRREADWLALTYRLHAWQVRQLASLDVNTRREAIERLASVAPPSWSADDARSRRFTDRFNSYLFEPRRFDYRASVLLHGLSCALDLVRLELRRREPDVPTSLRKGTLCNPELQNTLLELARRLPSRQADEPTWFAWSEPSLPADLATRALFKIEPELLVDLGEPTLLARIESIPSEGRSGSGKSAWELAEGLVVVLSDAADRLSARVRKALEARLKGLGSSPESSRLRWIGLTALFSSGAQYLEADVAQLLDTRLNEADDELALALSHYLVGICAIDAGRLETESHRLLGAWSQNPTRATYMLMQALTSIVAEGPEPLRPVAARFMVELTAENKANGE